jgi:hypothetical protein
MQVTAILKYAACNGDCLNCLAFLLRCYDTCSPENSFYYLDVYESMWGWQLRDRENCF